MNAEELVLEMTGAWATRDPAERERRLRACFDDNVEFVPPAPRAVVHGIDGLVAHVAEFTAGWPDGVTAELVPPADVSNGWARVPLRWRFPDRSAESTEIIRIVDGRIATFVVFPDPS